MRFTTFSARRFLLPPLHFLSQEHKKSTTLRITLNTHYPSRLLLRIHPAALNILRCLVHNNDQYNLSITVTVQRGSRGSQTGFLVIAHLVESTLLFITQLNQETGTHIRSKKAVVSFVHASKHVMQISGEYKVQITTTQPESSSRTWETSLEALEKEFLIHDALNPLPLSLSLFPGPHGHRFDLKSHLLMHPKHHPFKLNYTRDFMIDKKSLLAF